MSEEESKRLMQRRSELESQLESLKAQTRDGLYHTGYDHGGAE